MHAIKLVGLMAPKPYRWVKPNDKVQKHTLTPLLMEGRAGGKRGNC